MSVTPGDVWSFAFSVCTDAGEAARRSSISRAYYAAYHSAKIWHAKLPYPGSLGTSGGMHEQFINQLRNPAAACTAEQKLLSRSLAYSLIELRGHRTTADYDLASTLLVGLPSEVCGKAKIVLEKTN